MLQHKQGNSRHITSRESDVLRLISEGMTNREIADHLMISIPTVEAHRARIKIKLNIKTKAGLVRCAIKHSMTNEGNFMHTA